MSWEWKCRSRREVFSVYCFAYIFECISYRPKCYINCIFKLFYCFLNMLFVSLQSTPKSSRNAKYLSVPFNLGRSSSNLPNASNAHLSGIQAESKRNPRGKWKGSRNDSLFSLFFILKSFPTEASRTRGRHAVIGRCLSFIRGQRNEWRHCVAWLAGDQSSSSFSWRQRFSKLRAKRKRKISSFNRSLHWQTSCRKSYTMKGIYLG